MASELFDIAEGTVKICGVRDARHATVAAEAGAGLVGMIFASARRQVTPEVGRAIADAAHAAGAGAVGVFVDADPGLITRVVMAAGLDYVQLSGDEPPALLGELPVPAIKAFRARPGEYAVNVAARIEPYLAAAVPPAAVLLDGYDPVAHGGTGARADWALVQRVAAAIEGPVGLAGGLTPVNVHEAIATTTPLFVDVSSGVEVDGEKDDDLIRRFVRAAKAAFRDEVTVSAAPSSPRRPARGARRR